MQLLAWLDNPLRNRACPVFKREGKFEFLAWLDEPSAENAHKYSNRRQNVSSRRAVRNLCESRACRVLKHEGKWRFCASADSAEIARRALKREA